MELEASEATLMLSALVITIGGTCQVISSAHLVADFHGIHVEDFSVHGYQPEDIHVSVWSSDDLEWVLHIVPP